MTVRIDVFANQVKSFIWHAIASGYANYVAMVDIKPTNVLSCAKSVYLTRTDHTLQKNVPKNAFFVEVAIISMSIVRSAAKNVTKDIHTKQSIV